MILELKRERKFRQESVYVSGLLLWPLQGDWTTDVYTLHCYVRFLWYEVGRQHVKSQQATFTSPYLTSPTPPFTLTKDCHNTGNFMRYS